jgi:hypothetical protein
MTVLTTLVYTVECAWRDRVSTLLVGHFESRKLAF